MRKTVYGAAVAAALFVLPAHAEDLPEAKCTYREEPVAQPAPVAADQKKDKHRVTLLAMTPVEGAEVRAADVVELDVEYHVVGFAPEKFFLMVGFPTVSLGLMSPVEREDVHQLKAPSGKVHLCVPLKDVYEHAGVIWPLSLQVSINEQMSEGRSKILTETRRAGLNAMDAPAGALERKNAAMPEDVQRAVMMVFGYTENQGAMNKVCPARFPDLQTKFVKAYRSWEARNATNIRKVQELQYESNLSSTGSPASAAMGFDLTRAASIAYLGEFKDPLLLQICEDAMEALGDETSDLPIATAVNLEIVLDYLASKKKAEAAK